MKKAKTFFEENIENKEQMNICIEIIESYEELVSLININKDNEVELSDGKLK